MSVIDWLLEDDTPGVELLTRLHLLDEKPRSKAVVAARRRTTEDPSVAQLLDRVDEAIEVGNYKKYEGAFWTLLFLAELQAEKNDPRAKRLARHVLSTQLENGGFSPNGRPQFELVCLSANMLRALVHFGFGKSEGVIRGYDRLASRILEHGGVPCFVIEDHTVYSSCTMTIPQTLRCIAAAPPDVSPRKMKRVSRLLVDEIFRVHLYRYVRPDVADFRAAIAARPQGMTQREVKVAYTKQHASPSTAQLLPKKGWLKFGFPSNYNPDLLELLLALTELEIPYDPVMDEALDMLAARLDDNHRLKLDKSLNGKMLTTIEKKGRASKWLTVRGLRVLKHFGRWEG